MDPSRPTTALTAAEAARRLGVRRDTLYAYVSRGLVRSERQRGTRARRYDAEDVARLALRQQGRRDPGRVAAQVLHQGAPVLDSSLTLIRDGRLFYRGIPVEGLVGEVRFEQVASLLWGHGLGDPLDDVVPALPTAYAAARRALDALPRIERFQVVLSAKAAEDASAFELSAAGVRRVGAKVLRLLAAAAVGAAPSLTPAAQMLQRGWLPRRPAAQPLLDAALVLWADHELNVSTFTVRCVASARATPYAAVVAGLSALRGARHGGATEQVEALFDEVGRPERARDVLEARMRRGERIPGIGHPLYPGGDPRAAVLLARLAAGDVPLRTREQALTQAIADECHRLVDRRPNVDFATVALARGLGLPAGAALALVAVARSAGWIAHAIEQYASERLIRPRARYTGEAPDA